MGTGTCYLLASQFSIFNAYLYCEVPLEHQQSHRYFHPKRQIFQQMMFLVEGSNSCLKKSFVLLRFGLDLTAMHLNNE